MMHRYVVAVRTGDPGAFRRLGQALQRELQGFVRTLDADAAKAWVFHAAPSQLRHRPLGPHGCLIGLDAVAAVADPGDLLRESWGAYVAVSIDPSGGEVRVLRDPTGRIEAWRLSLPGGDLIFSHYQDVYRLQARPSVVDWDFLSHHLNQDYLHGADTCVCEVSELLPGAQLTYRSGRPTTAMAWSPNQVAASPHGAIEIAQSALRATAEVSVGFWAGRYRRITLDLSGGLDSAIMLGLLRTSPSPPHIVATNRHTPGEEGDERAYAREAAALHGVEIYEQTPTNSDVGFTTAFPRRLMRPRNRLLPLGYDEMGAELARRFEAEAFFTGTGGDHLFYDHLPVSAAADYLRHGGSLFGYPKVAVALAQLSQDTVWGVSAEVARALGRRRSAAEVGFMGNGFLSDRAREAVDFERYVHPWIAEGVGITPPAKLNQIANLIELQRHYYRYGRAEAAEETHALFSQPLLEASLRTPSHWFGLGGVQRGLARAAFADLLPEVIRDRRSKGSNAIYFIEFMQSRLSRIRDLLLGGRLSDNGLLDVPKVEAALTPLGLSSGKWFMALNICLTAELWVRQTESDAASALAERPAALVG